jgi:hypothetical protein
MHTAKLFINFLDCMHNTSLHTCCSEHAPGSRALANQKTAEEGEPSWVEKKIQFLNIAAQARNCILRAMASEWLAARLTRRPRVSWPRGRGYLLPVFLYRARR